MKKLILLIVASMFMTTCMPWGACAEDYTRLDDTGKAALERRKERFSEIDTLRLQGVIGENNKGYVEFRMPNAQYAAVVDAENNDRKAVYESLVRITPGADLATIETVSARKQKEKAPRGSYIQNDDGTWVTKL